MDLPASSFVHLVTISEQNRIVTKWTKEEGKETPRYMQTLSFVLFALKCNYGSKRLFWRLRLLVLLMVHGLNIFRVLCNFNYLCIQIVHRTKLCLGYQCRQYLTQQCMQAFSLVLLSSVYTTSFGNRFRFQCYENFVTPWLRSWMAFEEAMFEKCVVVWVASGHLYSN